MTPASLRLPPYAIVMDEGFVVQTRWRTLTRWQRGLDAAEEIRLLRAEAERQAERRAPRPHRMALVIVPGIRARLSDAAGRPFEAASQMTQRQLDHCRRCFRDFTDLVFSYTGGALRIEATEVVIDEPVTTLSTTGAGRYWLSAHDALRGREHLLPQDELDGLAVYYKMPAGLTPALHGGAVGRDHGVRGTSFWTLWVSDWSERPGPFSRTAIASLHEWLHNVSFHAHRVMGETAIPDCHAGEEYGYWDTDGGTRQWMAWNRDLMLRYIPRQFWYRLDSRGPLLPWERPGLLHTLGRLRRWLLGAGPRPWPTRVRRPGSVFPWRQVADDWMLRLPQLSQPDLRRLSGLPRLRVVLDQAKPNSYVVWSLDPGQPVDSPVFDGDPLLAPPRLDNVLSFGREDAPPHQGDAAGAYHRAPLESLAWLRSPNAPPARRDLVLLRPDLAPWLLPRLRSSGRRAEDSVVGYLARRDPAEGQRVNVIVAAFDFGPVPPTDEVDALAV